MIERLERLAEAHGASVTIARATAEDPGPNLAVGEWAIMFLWGGYTVAVHDPVLARAITRVCDEVEAALG